MSDMPVDDVPEGTSHSEIHAVLTEGRMDVWNAHPRILPFLFNPLREYLIDPALTLGTIALPPLANLVPHADAIIAQILKALILPLKYLYSFLPGPDDEGQFDLRRNAKNDILRAPGRPAMVRPPSDLYSAFRSAIAFACSAAADVIGAIMDRQKMKKWLEAIYQFKAYLDATGVGDELEEAMLKPMLRGRLLDNVKILNDIQEQTDADRYERVEKCGQKDIEDELKEGKRLMRFATAAYGTQMIKSAIDKEVDKEQLKDEKKAIAFHCNISEDDVRILYVSGGGDMKVLRHFVAVDRDTKSIVLALRGTLSVSGALVDMQAMDCDYCTGKAHKGIADMADCLWHESGEKINALFEEEELKEFGFLITGHSLGAGAACLLNIKCHLESLVGKRSVKCYGFAPPPTFYLCPGERDEICDCAIKDAIENTVCYIHDNDCVPLLSVASIRRLAKMLDAVDNKTELMWLPQRFKIFWEYEKIPKDIFDAVASSEKEKVRAVDGECKMIIPARIVVWMVNEFGGKFRGIGCEPAPVADLNIFVNQDMVSDHLPEMYEDALDALVD